MRLRNVVPVLAGVCVMLGCEKAPTSPEVLKGPSFITYGSPDGAAHPAVVLIKMDIAGQPAYRCSGTLLSSKLVLTAGHCTGEPGEFSGMRIFTESDVENGNNTYPYAGGPNSVEAASWHSHPLFTEAAFYLHDVGVILLKTGVVLPTGQYGTLPGVNQLDALQPRNSTKFTAVGYGLQRINPVFVENDLIRMSAQPHLIQINTGLTGDFSLLLSNNASSGGTCFGDSGGPNFLGTSGTVVAAVTSFGLNGTCGGTGGVFRMDRQNVLDFVNQYLK